jgi:hypothetical protein
MVGRNNFLCIVSPVEMFSLTPLDLSMTIAMRESQRKEQRAR